MFRQIVLLIFGSLVIGLLAPTASESPRPRVVVTTDGEIDDRCSMARFLLYANELDVEGLIYSSSKFHWVGNDWHGTDWIAEDLDRYAECYDNLRQHADGYPTPDQLRAVVYDGNIDNVGSMENDTPGSDRIVDVLLDGKPGPVYLQAWGGTNTIARALRKIELEHPGRIDEVAAKAVLYLILDQDDTYRDYIAEHWPDVVVLKSTRQFVAIGYQWAQSIPANLHRYFGRDWLDQNILSGHGPLQGRYEAHPQKGFRSEGDSPSFMHQIPVGLRSLENPGHGGWGGRFAKDLKVPGLWRDVPDDGDLCKPIWRFIPAFQNDWAARADWCVRPAGGANHPPVTRLAGEPNRTVTAGQRVELDASGSADPDGDPLDYHWWQYGDVDTAGTTLKLAGSDQPRVRFTVPGEPGKDLHLILEVTDRGTPALTRYQRLICKIAESN